MSERGAVWTGPARCDLRRLDPPIRHRIIAAVRLLAESDQGDCLPLRGSADLWRLRVGDWRVLFVRQPDEIIEMRVLPRGQAYQ